MESLRNPVSNVRKPKLPGGRERRLEKGEEDKLLEKARFPLNAMIILALETAMRQGEILSLHWENIDLKKRIAKLPDTKNGSERIIPLSNRALSVFNELPRQISGRVFPKISASLVSHNFSDLCEDAKIENLRFHDLRHEATSRLFEHGLDIMEVASITGHKTLHMLKRYTHLRAEDIAEKLG